MIFFFSDVLRRLSKWVFFFNFEQATLIRTSSIESKIRQITKEGIREYQLAGDVCVCTRPVIGEGCKNCMRREICERLRNAGFNSAICKSKWRKSPDIPSGK